MSTAPWTRYPPPGGPRDRVPSAGVVHSSPHDVGAPGPAAERDPVRLQHGPPDANGGPLLSDCAVPDPDGGRGDPRVPLDHRPLLRGTSSLHGRVAVATHAVFLRSFEDPADECGGGRGDGVRPPVGIRRGTAEDRASVEPQDHALFQPAFDPREAFRTARQPAIRAPSRSARSRAVTCSIRGIRSLWPFPRWWPRECFPGFSCSCRGRDGPGRPGSWRASGSSSPGSTGGGVPTWRRGRVPVMEAEMQDRVEAELRGGVVPAGRN